MTNLLRLLKLLFSLPSFVCNATQIENSRNNRYRTRLARFLGVVVLPLLFLASLDVQAGNLWLTGHDMDFHCSGGSGCTTYGIAVDFVRQDAPDKTLPILVLDEGSQVVAGMARPAATASNTVEGAGVAFPTVVVNPTSAAFATTVISVSNYSAIVIASDSTCGGCDNSAASITAINARTADLHTFFTAGGGILYNSGAARRDTYYASVPIAAPAVSVSGPFTVTAAGLALGMTDAEANCCATHNSFTLPAAGSPLVVAETDGAGFAETMFVSGGTIIGGEFGGSSAIPVPTLSEWALLLLVTLMLLVGVAFVRRLRYGPPAS